MVRDTVNTLKVVTISYHSQIAALRSRSAAMCSMLPINFLIKRLMLQRKAQLKVYHSLCARLIFKQLLGWEWMRFSTLRILSDPLHPPISLHRCSHKQIRLCATPTHDLLFGLLAESMMSHRNQSIVQIPIQDQEKHLSGDNELHMQWLVYLHARVRRSHTMPALNQFIWTEPYQIKFQM